MSFLKAIGKLLIPRAIRPTQLLGPQIQKKTLGTVYSGPFKGMKYLSHSYYNLYYPKILGTYEQELNPAIEQMIAANPECIIDIGAAEGYFVVGLARRLSKTHFIAFEAVATERDRLAELCKMNEVSHLIEIQGKCDPELLSAALQRYAKPYVICDVEGFEEVLLAPDKLKNCENASFLVEVHPFDNPQLESELVRRFSPTHTCQVIRPVPRLASEYPFSSFLTKILPKVFLTGPMYEFRPKTMVWLFMTPKA